MIAVTRIIVSATPRNETAPPPPGRGGRVLKNLFFLRGGSDPRPKPLYYRFIYHFRQKRCPFRVPLLTILDKSSWDNNAIFIIFCNFCVPRITVQSFRTFLAVSPLNLHKVKTRKKFWIHASNVVRGVREGVGQGCRWKTPHKCKSVPRLLSRRNHAVSLCTIFDMSSSVNQKVFLNYSQP